LIEVADINGNPFLGVYFKASDSVLVGPEGAPRSLISLMEEVLDVRFIPIKLGGSPLIGSLLVMNSRGAIVTRNAFEDEVKELKKEVTVEFLPHKLNAVGNNMAVNQKGALLHPSYPKRIVKIVEDVLGVEAQRGTVAAIKTVGSVVVASDRGFICHPKTTDDELKFLSELFGVEGMRGTANYGSPYLGACVVANSRGAVVGRTSTGIELGRIEDALNLYQVVP